MWELQINLSPVNLIARWPAEEINLSYVRRTANWIPQQKDIVGYCSKYNWVTWKSFLFEINTYDISPDLRNVTIEFWHTYFGDL